MIDSNSTVINPKPKSKFSRLHLLGILFTLLGVGIFVYFVASVGFDTVLEGISRIGFDGFILILFVYLLRLSSRAAAWKLSVNAPYKLSLFDTLQAVIIGEALSTMLPLGILVSGTAKAIAVKRRVPLVVGFSSVATENLFYSLGAGLVIVFGGVLFLRNFDLPEGWVLTIDFVIGLITILTVLGFLMVIRQWHWISAICEKLYQKGIVQRLQKYLNLNHEKLTFWQSAVIRISVYEKTLLQKPLENGRNKVRIFEDLIYGFYRQHPKRFVPIFLLQVLFHALGVLEAWFILSRISSVLPTISTAFLIESISRVIVVVFKLIPFVIGVDEAGAQFVTDTLALGAGVGVTLAIIRKGRVLFWTGIGILLILTRELSIGEILTHHESAKSADEKPVLQDEINNKAEY